MKPLSLRSKLMLSGGLGVTVILIVAFLIIHRSITTMLADEIRKDLIASASILTKSSELEPSGVAYEWHEALKSNGKSEVIGVFQFWDQTSGHSVGSPELKASSLEKFHGKLNEAVIKKVTLPDGKSAWAVGILHLPFLDAAGVEEMKHAGTILKPEDFPQVLVYAHETTQHDAQIAYISKAFLIAGLSILAAIWGAIWTVIHRSLKTINDFSKLLDEHSSVNARSTIPDAATLPEELTGLTTAYNRILARLEADREREKQFAMHAAHELRTPIAGIQATLEQAVNRPRTEEDLKQRIHAALGIVKNMSSMVNSLMRLARMRGGIEKQTREPFDPAASVWLVVDQHQEEFDQYKVHVQRNGIEKTTSLMGDLDLFQMIISILLDNITRHAPQDSEASVSIIDENHQFSVSFKNKAPQLNQEHLTQLLEPFQRGPQAASVEGAGLGLSLAKEIATMLDGTLNLSLDVEQNFTAEVLFSRV